MEFNHGIGNRDDPAAGGRLPDTWGLSRGVLSLGYAPLTDVGLEAVDPYIG